MGHLKYSSIIILLSLFVVLQCKSPDQGGQFEIYSEPKNINSLYLILLDIEFENYSPDTEFKSKIIQFQSSPKNLVTKTEVLNDFNLADAELVEKQQLIKYINYQPSSVSIDTSP